MSRILGNGTGKPFPIVTPMETPITMLENAMHWLPMTPDAVFEDGGKYLLATTRNNDWPWAGVWDAEYTVFRCALGTSWLLREVTHYARITEPR